MKFTYTHITKNYTEITEYKVNKNNKIKVKKLCTKHQNTGSSINKKKNYK